MPAAPIHASAIQGTRSNPPSRDWSHPSPSCRATSSPPESSGAAHGKQRLAGHVCAQLDAHETLAPAMHVWRDGRERRADG
eukprot:9930890-Alexandrium_andersonii.AAC.1